MFQPSVALALRETFDSQLQRATQQHSDSLRQLSENYEVRLLKVHGERAALQTQVERVQLGIYT